MLHMFAALAMTALAAAPIPSNQPPHTTLIVQLIHRTNPKHRVPGRIVGRMKEETARIWSSLDVQIQWIDSPRLESMVHPAGLTAFLEDGEYPGPVARGLVLGAVTHPGSDCGWGLAHVWVRHIERFALLARRDTAGLPAALAETFFARALGRALAHEIGHYLLGTREHTTDGLMRQQFSPQDLLEEASRPLDRLDVSTRSRLISCRTEQAVVSEER